MEMESNDRATRRTEIQVPLPTIQRTLTQRSRLPKSSPLARDREEGSFQQRKQIQGLEPTQALRAEEKGSTLERSLRIMRRISSRVQETITLKSI